ncbi:MAG: 50S ribosomal protein L35 [marine actinobacterium MedAcidi-G2B]|nr:MAG: 50S ribosomal protein L35 [marine actinobacterium MedAcidi-G2B]MAU49955.1 50S ribosomal protein L35 [Actinomycetota bacterium]|tara:strand:+ start:217 stop:411 length:195 start_codon:yes stop_codon:yes gene_type:complete
MPKMKTHRGLAKRVKVTGTGRLRRRSPNLSHILEKKTPQRKRRLSGESDIAKADEKSIRTRLGK